MTTHKVIVSACIYKDKECLIIKRDNNKKIFPGVWEAPGGHLEIGEDPMEGVIREVKEETNLDVQILGIHHVWSYEVNKTHYVQIGFILKPITEEIVLEDGHTGYEWVTKDKLKDYNITKDQLKEIKIGFDWIEKH